MSTGDLKGWVRKLDSMLRTIKYPRDVDYTGLSKGDPSAFLPILDFTLTTFSPFLTAQLVAAEFELTGKTDLRFIDAVYKVLRDIFQYKPVLSKQQFLQCGFSQSKISVICEIINLVLQRHKQLKREKGDVRPSHSPSRLFNTLEVVVPRNTSNSLCKEPYSGNTVGGSLPFPQHSYNKENNGLRNIPESQKCQLPNKGKEDDALQNVQAVEEGISSMEGRLESFSLALEKPILGTQLESLHMALERLNTLATRVESLHMALERLDTLGTRVESLHMALERLHTLETRVESLPLALEKLSVLENRLDKLETYLEKGPTCGNSYKNQDVTISKESWENLLSRVVLLEAKQELASIQSKPLEGSQNIRHAISPVESSLQTCISPLSCPQQDDLKDRLERITSMMKNTSNLLKSTDVSNVNVQ